MNKLLVLLLSLGVWSISFSQQTYETEFVNTTGMHSLNWVTYLDNEDFSIEYAFENCDPPMGYDKEMVVLRITNKTSHVLTLNWLMELYYDEDSCKTCDFEDEYTYVVNLKPSEMLEGNCEMNSDFRLKIFSRFNDVNYAQGDQLNGFRLGNLTANFVQID